MHLVPLVAALATSAFEYRSAFFRTPYLIRMLVLVVLDFV